MPQDLGNGFEGIVIEIGASVDFINASNLKAILFLTLGIAALGEKREEKLCSNGCHVLVFSPVFLDNKIIGTALVSLRESTPEDILRLGDDFSPSIG